MVNSPLIRPYFLGGGGIGGVPLGSHESISQGSKQKQKKLMEIGNAGHDFFTGYKFQQNFQWPPTHIHFSIDNHNINLSVKTPT